MKGRWDAERGERVGAAALAGDGAVATFSHGDACRGAEDGHGVEMLNLQSIAAGSAGDDAGTSGVVQRPRHARSSLANEPTHRRSRLLRERGEIRLGLGRNGSAVIWVTESVTRSVVKSELARSDSVNEFNMRIGLRFLRRRSGILGSGLPNSHSLLTVPFFHYIARAVETELLQVESSETSDVTTARHVWWKGGGRGADETGMASRPMLDAPAGGDLPPNNGLRKSRDVHVAEHHGTRLRDRMAGHRAGTGRGVLPGPLTLVLPKADGIVEIVTAGGTTVGVRLPRHPFIELIRTCRFPLAAPSANLSNHISPTTAAHVQTQLAGRIPLVIDGTGTGRHRIHGNRSDRRNHSHCGRAWCRRPRLPPCCPSTP